MLPIAVQALEELSSVRRCLHFPEVDLGVLRQESYKLCTDIPRRPNDGTAQHDRTPFRR
jgi:hypothetical protein